MRHTAWPTISEQAQMAAAPPRTPTSVTGCRPRTRPSTSMKPSSPGDRAPHRWMRPTRVPEGPLEIRVPTDVENVRLNSRKPSVAKVGRVRAVAQPGSALRSGRRGREFKSPQPDVLSMRSIVSLTICLAFMVIGCGGGDDAAGKTDTGGAQIPLAGSTSTGTVTSPSASGAVRGVSLRRIGSFQAPTYLTAPKGDTRRLFVVEQAGTIRVVQDGKKL